MTPEAAEVPTAPAFAAGTPVAAAPVAGTPVAGTVADALRTVMRVVPQPVTVVTSVHGGEAVGAVIGSFTSVSLDPPLFSFNLQHGSALREAIEAGAPFAVHILGADQADLAARFARPGVPQAERFDGPPDRDPDGVPVLPALARLRGRCHARVIAGDHLLVIADVIAVEHAETDTRDALAYARRAFGSVRANGLE